MEEEQKEVKEEETKKDINSLPYRIYSISGAIATITLIVLILYTLKIIPSSVSLSIGLFVSLPLIYSFIFGIIFNRPNFAAVLRHYSFAIYIIVALVIYMIILRPDSLILGIRYFFHFFLGFVLAIIGYFCYATSFRLLKKYKYSISASISFGVSFIITLIITLLLKYFKIFKLV